MVTMFFLIANVGKENWEGYSNIQRQTRPIDFDDFLVFDAIGSIPAIYKTCVDIDVQTSKSLY